MHNLIIQMIAERKQIAITENLDKSAIVWCVLLHTDPTKAQQIEIRRNAVWEIKKSKVYVDIY